MENSKGEIECSKHVVDVVNSDDNSDTEKSDPVSENCCSFVHENNSDVETKGSSESLNMLNIQSKNINIESSGCNISNDSESSEMNSDLETLDCVTENSCSFENNDSSELKSKEISESESNNQFKSSSDSESESSNNSDAEESDKRKSKKIDFNSGVKISAELCEQIFDMRSQKKQYEANAIVNDKLNINNFSAPILPWLSKDIIPTHVVRSENNKGIFRKLAENIYHENSWKLFEHTIPIYYNKKYYDINELIKPSTETNNYMSIISSIIMFHETCGLSHLNHMIQIQNDWNDVKHGMKKTQDKCEKWLINTKSLVLAKKYMYVGNLIETPTIDDLCTDASEFLLDHFVLLQLPWNAVLLHQWLLAALAEVLVFEIESIELKHWPLNENNVDIVHVLFSLIRDLKERIMLGFAILNEQATMYPNIDKKHPNYVLDSVVVPAFPVLKFLLKNNCKTLITSLRNCGGNNNAVYLSSNCYHLDSNLDLLHNKFAYNIHMWNTMDKNRTFFPLVKEKFENIVGRINTKKTIGKKFDLISNKAMSLDEKTLLQIMENNLKISKLTNEIKIKITVNIINTEIIAKNKLPGVTLQDIEKKFSTPRVRKQAGEIFLDKKLDIVHVVIRQALLYNEAYSLLVESEKEESAASQIICLQLYILEVEQLTRLTNTLAILFKTSPVLVSETSNIDHIKQQLSEVIDECKSVSRDVLWETSPEVWAKCKDTSELCTVYRLLLSLAKLSYEILEDNFQVVSNGGTQFKEFSIVYYFLRSMSILWYEETLKNSDNFELYKLIDNLIHHYETCYLKWKENKIIPCSMTYQNKKKKIMTLGQQIDHTFSCLEKWLASKKIYDRLKAILLINLPCALPVFETNDSSFLYELIRKVHYLSDYPSAILKILQPSYGLCCISDKGFDFTTELLQTIFEVVMKLYDMPNPQTVYEVYPEFTELFYMSCVLSEMDIVADCMAFNPRNSSKLNITLQKSRELSQAVEYNQISIMYSVCITSGSDQNVEKNIKNCRYLIEKHFKPMYQCYEALKEARQLHGFISLDLKQRLPYCRVYRRIDRALEHYINNDLNALDKVMPLFAKVDKNVVEETTVEKCCRQCGKTEATRKLIPCEKCVEVGYPDVNYFCGRRCIDARWKAEHMAEHLEFELGLGDFANKSVNNEDFAEAIEWEEQLELQLGLGKYFMFKK